MSELTDYQIKQATNIVFRDTSVKVGFTREVWEKLSSVLQKYLDIPSQQEVLEVFQKTPGNIVSTSLFREALTNFVYIRNNPTKPITVDVERAKAWLEKNHPNESSRHVAELLHDYSLSVIEDKK